jgi:hypothetical protein
MNSLEWINDIINLYKKEIKRLKESIKSTLPIHEKAIESLTRNCEEIKKELNILQQIKTILEAWEVCMNDNAILDVIKTLAKGEPINWHSLPKEQQESLKKGLMLYDKQNSNK